MIALIAALGGWCATLRANAQSITGYYGSGIQFDVLNNQRVTGADIDYRFRAVASGSVSGFIWYDAYVKGGSSADCDGIACGCDGYGCGTGGKLEICIYSDDGTPSHLPSDPITQHSRGLQTRPLGCVRPSNLRSGPTLRTELFPVFPVLTAGSLYHLHWHNDDPDPVKNYVSVDDICVWHPTSPRQPTISDIDLAVLVGTNIIATDSPIFQLNYVNGKTQGQGYKESWIYTPETISGFSKVREWIEVSGSNRTVISVSVRVNRIGGAGPLIVILSDDSGVIIERGAIPASNFPAGSRLTSDAWASQYATPVWGTYIFTTPHTLVSGHRYQLILSASSDSVYQSYGIQKAAGYNFSSHTFYSDGRGQYSRDNGLTWTGFRQSEYSLNHIDADIQFYFETQRSSNTLSRSRFH